jgi:hypothetical protein
MKYESHNRIFAGMIMLLLLLGLTACSSGPIDRNTQFTLGQSLQVNNQSTSTIAVDLVGVNATDYKRWYNYSMTRYFSAGDLLRSGAVKATINFTPGSSAKVVFSKHNPIWKQWKKNGDTYLFVLAQLPGIRQDMPGPEDPRRLILPLQKSRWPDSANPIRILIKNSGVVCLTPPKPKKS